MAKAKYHYRRVKSPGHPRADERGRVLEHVLLAEKALGRALPPGVEVHHVDGNGRNNSPGNLVICQNRTYHDLLHTRMRALAECGHADWRRCKYCHTHDQPSNMFVRPGLAYHRVCHNHYRLRMQRLKDPRRMFR